MILFHPSNRGLFSYPKYFYENFIFSNHNIVGELALYARSYPLTSINNTRCLPSLCLILTITKYSPRPAQHRHQRFQVSSHSIHKNSREIDYYIKEQECDNRFQENFHDTPSFGNNINMVDITKEDGTFRLKKNSKRSSF